MGHEEYCPQLSKHDEGVLIDNLGARAVRVSVLMEAWGHAMRRTGQMEVNGSGEEMVAAWKRDAQQILGSLVRAICDV